ncbi:stabilizer of axonemal microtubules 3-like [Sycon ciliatum]|uniref:stabilizer of axonemal microtubules 3-like n=1 Tax=Sycon ciliatum TaxID=27933 RepID=UPI0020ADC842|eukprot:scpid65621/ scgid20498/ 
MAEESIERVIWQTKTLQPAQWRDDWALTSTGVGHAYTAAQDRDVTAIKRTTQFPLPPVLRDQESRSTGQEYLTTTGTYHSYQPLDTVVAHPENSRAAPCYKTHHNEGFTYRLKGRPWREPLSIEHQRTEKQDKYRGERAKPLVNSEFGTDLRPLNLAHHHGNLPLKLMNPTEPKDELITSGTKPHEGGVMNAGEEFMTTSRQVHHKFTRKQQLELPCPDQATVYHCQQYPKAWGHSSQKPAMSLHQVPEARGLEMMDSMTFKHRCHNIMPSYMLPPVPNSGVTTMKSSYRRPSEETIRSTHQRPFNRLHHLTAPVEFEIPMAPQMYKSGNTMYGTAPF